MGDSSPFSRSSKLQRSPPPTPQPSPRSQAQLPTASEQPCQPEPETVTTSDLHRWMSTIEQHLNDICHISSEGKLNSEQKQKVHGLCRKVAHCTSSMALQYQSLKAKALLTHASLQALKEKQDLSDQLQALKESIVKSANPITSTLSFADMVKTSNNNHIRPSHFSTVAIYPNDKLKSSEETKSLVQQIINPEQMKLHVRAVRKVRNGGVIISTDSKDDIEKLKTTFKKSSSDLTIDEPSKRKPRIVIIGVPSSLQESDVFNCIYEQNLADKLQDLSRENVLSSIKLSHKSGKKDAETCNYIIEVSASIRKALICQDRVFINWSSCPVRDFTIVTRCFKCQQFGHAAKTCKQTDYTCGHCADIGHSIKECPKKGETPICATCELFKKPSSHKTGDAECPARKMAEQRYINSIDYEGA